METLHLLLMRCTLSMKCCYYIPKGRTFQDRETTHQDRETTHQNREKTALPRSLSRLTGDNRYRKKRTLPQRTAARVFVCQLFIPTGRVRHRMGRRDNRDRCTSRCNHHNTNRPQQSCCSNTPRRTGISRHQSHPADPLWSLRHRCCL